MLREVERLFFCGRTGSGRPVPCQSLRFVSCSWQALRSVLIPIARESLSFPLAMAIEGQWKGMSLQKTEKYWKRTDASCPVFWFIDCFRQKTVGQKGIRMQLKTILNRVQKHQSFIYTDM